MEEKPRNMMEKSGFKDGEIGSKAHDDIVLALLDEELMFKVIAQSYPEISKCLGKKGSELGDKLPILSDADWNESHISDDPRGEDNIKKLKENFFKHTPVTWLPIWDYFALLPGLLDKSRLELAEIEVFWLRWPKSEPLPKEASNLKRLLFDFYNGKKETGELKDVSLECFQEQISNMRWDFFFHEVAHLKITSEAPIMKGTGEYKSIVGYADFLVDLQLCASMFFSPIKGMKPWEVKEYKFLIEVKTRVDSVGAVLRQFRTYMEFTKAHPILVAPVSDKIKTALESQGISVFVWDDKLLDSK